MAVPWIQIIRWAPQIITLSRELLHRSQRTSQPDPATPPGEREDLARITALEENERVQAQLVERMAEQQAQLTRAVLALHARQRLLLVAIGVLVVAVIVLGWRAFS
jgi:hypothetical protein